MYKVPIIPPDLRHEETIIQAASALDCLQKTINFVFEKIDARITKNLLKVSELGERINKAQTKIKNLEGTKNAIKIYSPARFPATTVFRDIPLTFVPTTMQVNNAGAVSDCLSKGIDVQSHVDAAVSQTIKEKLVFFHVRTDRTNAEHGRLASARIQTNQHISMGSVPGQLRSVNSIFCLNTANCVYGLDTTDHELNSWKRAKMYKNQRPQMQHTKCNTQKQLLDPAPHSLANRNQKISSDLRLRYTPRLYEAPEIDLPMDLPDLPGIADDIQFEGKEQQQIAPSLFIENLPELLELEQANETVTNIPAKKSETLDVEKQQKTQEVTPPPPPPPAPVVSIVAPPPPPPPPPLPPTISIAPPSVTVSAGPKTEAAKADVISNSRSELMDAIRKAGGAKGGRLRSAAAPVDVVDTKLTVTSHTSSGKGRGDLMADLHNKLLMRRKGISGAKDNNNSISNAGSSNPLISRLSALITPPAVKAAHEQHSDDDDDNDNDWVD